MTACVGRQVTAKLSAPSLTPAHRAAKQLAGGHADVW